MKTVLFETNAISRCLDVSLSGAELSIILQKRNLHPVVNIHSTYELARTFLNPTSHEKGKLLFTILKELNPIISCPTQDLLKREIKKLRDGTTVDFFCSRLLESQAREAIDNVAMGNFTAPYEKFIRDNENKFHSEQNMWDKLIPIKKEKKFKSISYEDFVKSYMNPTNISKVISHIYQHTEENLTNTETMKFLSEPNSYPALKTLIRAELYLNYLVLTSGNRPAKDKTDDFRHLIDSSYCSALVTNDVKFTSIAPQINGEIEIITFENVVSSY